MPLVLVIASARAYHEKMETRPVEQCETSVEAWQARVLLLQKELGIRATGPPRYHWEEDALCTQLFAETFISDGTSPGAAAKKVCNQCEVRAECLDRALSCDEEQAGIWGGLSQIQRRRLPDTIKRVY